MFLHVIFCGIEGQIYTPRCIYKFYWKFAIVAGLDLSGLGYFSEAGPSTPPASPPASSPPANEPISDQKTLTNGSGTGSRDTSANSDMGAIIGGIVGGIIGVVLLAGCLGGHPCLRKKYWVNTYSIRILCSTYQVIHKRKKSVRAHASHTPRLFDQRMNSKINWGRHQSLAVYWRLYVCMKACLTIDAQIARNRFCKGLDM